MSDDAQLWYGGLRFAGERSLSEDERSVVVERVRGLNRSAAITLGLCALAFVIIGFGIVQPMLFIIGIPFLLVAGKMTERSEGLTKFASNLRRDRKRGVVHMAHGTVADVVSEHLVKLGDRDHDPIEIAVLPHSGLVLARNGRSTEYEFLVPVKKTSAVPAQAAMAANFVRPTAVDDVFAHQRTLTDGELRELEQYAPKVSFTMYVLTVLLIVTWVVLAAMCFRGDVDFFYPFYGVLPPAFVTYYTWRRWRTRRRIAPDLAAAFVVIVRVREGDDFAPPQEFLPSSRILWTSNGVPANWRKVVNAS